MKRILLLLMVVPMIGFGQEIGCVTGDCKNGEGMLNDTQSQYNDL